jgi:hypothetical protein
MYGGILFGDKGGYTFLFYFSVRLHLHIYGSSQKELWKLRSGRLGRNRVRETFS